jgi:hypothetical protein
LFTQDQDTVLHRAAASGKLDIMTYVTDELKARVNAASKVGLRVSGLASAVLLLSGSSAVGCCPAASSVQALRVRVVFMCCVLAAVAFASSPSLTLTRSFDAIRRPVGRRC